MSPHADVLYNIAASYEQLGELRSAASYYQRYLDGSPSAPDRTKVTAKLTELRDRAAPITISAEGAAVTIVIDGDRVGTAPVTRRLPGGPHQIVGESASGRATRVVTVEYGEPQTVRLVAASGQGTLVISANAPNARVTIDGVEVGTAPWSGPVAAGTHTVILSAPDYTTVERTIDVPADGTAQIQGALGRPLGYVAPTPPEQGGSHLVVETGPYLGQGYLIAIGVGYRATSQRYELSSSFAFGNLGYGWALRGRLFVATGVVRPYIVGAVNYGYGMSSAYGGGGLLLATGRDRGIRLDYFVETGYGGGNTGGESYRFVPIMAGVSLRLARSQP